MHAFCVSDSDKVEAFLFARIEALQQASDKKISKAWIKAICPQKQARFPYSRGKKKHADDDTVAIKDVGSAEDDLASTPDSLDEVPPKGDLVRVEKRRRLLKEIYEVAEWEEEYLNSGQDMGCSYEEIKRPTPVILKRRRRTPSVSSSQDADGEDIKPQPSISCRDEKPVKRLRRNDEAISDASSKLAQQMSTFGIGQEARLEKAPVSAADTSMYRHQAPQVPQQQFMQANLLYHVPEPQFHTAPSTPMFSRMELDHPLYTAPQQEQQQVFGQVTDPALHGFPFAQHDAGAQVFYGPPMHQQAMHGGQPMFQLSDATNEAVYAAHMEQRTIRGDIPMQQFPHDMAIDPGQAMRSGPSTQHLPHGMAAMHPREHHTDMGGLPIAYHQQGTAMQFMGPTYPPRV
ncbi:hypothetical protein B0A55_06198 [Friedmanniomyces simplex]|uniref:Subtelomeric hrmA-associated cluster protein AFUB-079030/YDR124W-like helical bundle domain-containing protein n=1 Tax=Friedmanniomyces simplex TaxID=329884 RepID=A0A4V5NGB5_9PEZI|nr:hypothetical protein B0A55_06198 [Friedmanniomyces simplex]